MHTSRETYLTRVNRSFQINMDLRARQVLSLYCTCNETIQTVLCRWIQSMAVSRRTAQEIHKLHPDRISRIAHHTYFSVTFSLLIHKNERMEAVKGKIHFFITSLTYTGWKIKWKKDWQEKRKVAQRRERVTFQYDHKRERKWLKGKEWARTKKD